MNIILKKMVVKCPKDIEVLFNKMLRLFPRIKDKIILEGRKKEKNNWKSKKRWNAKQKAAREHKE